MSFDNGQRLGGWGAIPKAWRYVILIAGIAALVGLFYAEEDWRGRSALQRYEKELAARGEPVKAAELIPPRPSDDQNFAMTPFLAPLFNFEPGTQHWRDTNGLAQVQNFASEFSAAMSEVKAPKSARSNSWVRTELNLRDWDFALHNPSKPGKTPETTPVSNNLSRTEAAAGILSVLSRYDPVLDELRTASRRSSARFNLAYDNENPAAVLLPHLAFVKRATQVLQLRACAELAEGKTAEALADVQFMFYLLHSIHGEPILISHLVRISTFSILLQPIAEGLANHQWSDGQLAALEEQLGKVDFVGDGYRTLQGERVVFGGRIIDYVRRAPSNMSVLNGENPGERQRVDFVSLFFAVAPRGWLDFEKLNYYKVFEEFLPPTIDPRNQTVSPDAARKSEASLEKYLRSPIARRLVHHRIFIGLLMPALSRAVQRTANGQTAVNEAILACAIERYRLAHGSYPDSLDSLAPQFIARLPHDVVNGQPLKYHRTESGQYVLYSVGWNGKDDGGVIALNKTGESVDFLDGDWVWRPVLPEKVR